MIKMMLMTMLMVMLLMMRRKVAKMMRVSMLRMLTTVLVKNDAGDKNNHADDDVCWHLQSCALIESWGFAAFQQLPGDWNRKGRSMSEKPLYAQQSSTNASFLDRFVWWMSCFKSCFQTAESYEIRITQLWTLAPLKIQAILLWRSCCGRGCCSPIDETKKTSLCKSVRQMRCALARVDGHTQQPWRSNSFQKETKNHG